MKPKTVFLYEEMESGEGYVLASEYDKLMDGLSESQKEKERLTKSLAKANNGFEEYERNFYLKSDDLEKAEAREVKWDNDFRRMENRMAKFLERAELAESKLAAKSYLISSLELTLANATTVGVLQAERIAKLEKALREYRTWRGQAMKIICAITLRIALYLFMPLDAASGFT